MPGFVPKEILVALVLAFAILIGTAVAIGSSPLLSGHTVQIGQP